METVRLLLVGGSTSEPDKDASRLANQTALAQVQLLITFEAYFISFI